MRVKYTWIALALTVNSTPILQTQYPIVANNVPKKQHEMILPMYDNEPEKRRKEIEEKRKGFLYGKSLLGNSSYFPTGTLGDAMVQTQQRQWYAEADPLTQAVGFDSMMAFDALEKVASTFIFYSSGLTGSRLEG